MKQHVFAVILAVVLLIVRAPLVLAVYPAAVSGTWQMAPSMPAPLMSHQAVLLHDGRVLVLGGESVLGVPTRTTQLYDPSTRTWSTPTRMPTARIGFTATVLRDDRVLVVGGIGTAMNDLDSAEVFDPRATRWSVLPALPQTRFSQTASLLADGRVLLAGGIVNHVISRSTILFDPVDNAFTSGPATHFPHAQQGAVTLTDARVLIAGGYGGEPEVYDPRSGAWRRAGITPQRIRPVMTELADGSVLLAGGTDAQGHDLNTVSVFHPRAGRWTFTAPLHVRGNASSGGLLPDGQAFVAGGEQVNHHVVLRSAELYDPVSGSWRWAEPMHVARSGSTSTLLSNGTVLVCGGGGFDGALSSCELLHPATRTKSRP